MSAMLVTGAGGFIGQALCATLAERGLRFVPVARAHTGAMPGAAIVGNISPETDWRAHLKNIDVVTHLAGRVHRPQDGSAELLHEYRRANVESTLNLARQCVESGVRRLIFLSSIKVHGAASRERPFRVSDPPAPSDPYAISKWEAEQGLLRIARQSGLEVVVIRPPLVYGPKVKANFLALMRLVWRSVPLPLASVKNRRSMIFVGNLVDLILRCASSAAAAGQTFLAADGEDVGTADLIRILARAMGKRPALFSVPPSWLHAAASLCGKRSLTERLMGSLQVDIEPTVNTLEWRPPYALVTGIDLTVRDFLASEAVRRIA